MPGCPLRCYCSAGSRSSPPSISGSGPPPDRTAFLTPSPHALALRPHAAASRVHPDPWMPSRLCLTLGLCFARTPSSSSFGSDQTTWGRMLPLSHLGADIFCWGTAHPIHLFRDAASDSPCFLRQSRHVCHPAGTRTLHTKLSSCLDTLLPLFRLQHPSLGHCVSPLHTWCLSGYGFRTGRERKTRGGEGHPLDLLASPSSGKRARGEVYKRPVCSLCATATEDLD